MLTFLATFAVFVLVIFGMSLGWIIKRKSIQGSCGGISSIGMEKVCDCPEPCDARKKDGAGAAAPNFVNRDVTITAGRIIAACWPI